MTDRPNFHFRQAQAAFDLIHLLQSLDDSQLARAGSEAFLTVVHDHSCRFENDADAKCFETLLPKAMDATVDAEIAVAMFVANDLQKGLWHGDAREIAGIAKAAVRRAPHHIRSALLRGLDALDVQNDLFYWNDPAKYLLPDESRLTRPLERILPKLCEIARAMDMPTRKSVAAADYGYDTDGYLVALNNVLSDNSCLIPDNGYRYPSEVVELVSHSRSNPGFVPCTALLLANALQGKDNQGWFEFRWSNLAADYNALPDDVGGPILAGLRYLYETGEDFLCYTGCEVCDPVTAQEGMIGYVKLPDDDFV